MPLPRGRQTLSVAGLQDAQVPSSRPGPIGGTGSGDRQGRQMMGAETLNSFEISPKRPAPTAATAAVSGPKIPMEIDTSMKKSYTGGFQKLPIGFHLAWKPNRSKRELPSLPKAEGDNWAEDMIFFQNADNLPAVIDTVEELMMACNSIPAPYLLYDSERYFVFPAGSNITWEDPTFVDCGCIKFETPASMLYENPVMGMDLWICALSLTTGGVLSALNESYDIRGLRITRKKGNLSQEFWIGRKNIKEGAEVEVIPEVELHRFKDAILDQLTTNIKDFYIPNINIQKFSH